MQGHTVNTQQELIKTVPASVLEDVACFVFYDNHPRDMTPIDITVCTKNGELKEYFRRDMLSSINLEASSAPTEILIMRNSNPNRFYIVGAEDELFIVSTIEKLNIHTKITNVDNYTVNDFSCSGQTFLKVTTKDDAVPLIFDENFIRKDVSLSVKRQPNIPPIICMLHRNYTQAQYNINSLNKTLQEHVKLRHAATWLACHNLHPNHGDSAFRPNSDVSDSSIKFAFDAM